MAQITKFYDKNGVSFFKNDIDKFKTSTISVSIHCPLKEETVTLNALLPFVLKRGSRDLPGGTEVYSYLYDMYGANLMNNILKKGEDQILSFGLDFVSEKYITSGDPITDQALYFMKQIVFTPQVANDSFDESYVNSEKENLANYIQGLMNDKKEYAAQRCSEEMFPNDPYGIYGYGKLEQLENIDGKALYKEYLDVLSNCKIDIFISGDVSEKKVIDQFSYLADGRTDKNCEYPKTTQYSAKPEVKRVTQQMEVEQAKLCMGLFTAPFNTARDYYTCAVLNTVLGGGPQSKMFNQVREKLSLCYYVFSKLDRQKSAMFIAAGIKSGDFQKAYDAILMQLDAVKNGEITSEELDASKKYYCNAMSTLKDSVFQYEDYYTSCLIAGEIKDVSEVIELVNQTTVEDIVNFAKSIQLDTVYYLTNSNQ